MRNTLKLRWVVMVLLALCLAACAGYTESGSKSSEQQGMNGGSLTVSINKANGTTEKDIELKGALEGASDVILDANVTLAVGKGSYTIELLGENDQVTLTLQASDGQTVEGQGWMVTDSFGEASYRVTALNAENVDYYIEYTFR